MRRRALPPRPPDTPDGYVWMNIQWEKRRWTVLVRQEALSVTAKIALGEEPSEEECAVLNSENDRIVRELEKRLRLARAAGEVTGPGTTRR